MSDNEKKPAAATEDLDGPPPEIAVEPLGPEYAELVAKDWPSTAQAKPIINKLPQGLRDMLDKQSDDFILGFLNGAACSHDLGIKAPLNDVRNRLMAIQGAQRTDPNGPISTASLVTPVDRLVITAAAMIEGIGYIGALALLGKQEKENND